ncbi:helix-turn-helix domain-containing protein [Mycolicibacterium goodii]|uniref:helix-turn-helix domain-containing protein n=1 Tax=Mycolicibacterium goodii TaxID=134601 RepID=UPI001BDC4EFB|nr:helix-turn-helix domain-containing protein [Mycolicibacterium goodii]MBU8820395.1 helix-turn-helix domain-containing protein [Mycolicibacterium goodii]
MQVNPELDQLLYDRFGVTTEAFLAALRALPPLQQPRAAALTDAEAHLLDRADFTEDYEVLASVGIGTAGSAARLGVTAFTVNEVAVGLGVSVSRIRQKRLAKELWAINVADQWLYPALQFETGPDGPVRQVPGLNKVFQALPAGLHPVAVAGFLSTQQPALFRGRPMTPLQWLREGGAVHDVVAAAACIDWSAT